MREANALTLESNRSEEVVYQPESYDRFVGRLMEAFDRDFFRRTAGLGLAATAPGVRCRSAAQRHDTCRADPSQPSTGVWRGGAVLRSEILRRADGCGGPKRVPIECVASMDEYSLKRLAGEHLAKLNALDLGRCARIVDKLPDNMIYLGLLRPPPIPADTIDARSANAGRGGSLGQGDHRPMR